MKLKSAGYRDRMWKTETTYSIKKRPTWKTSHSKYHEWGWGIIFW
jgi:hypothetical protein